MFNLMMSFLLDRTDLECVNPNVSHYTLSSFNNVPDIIARRVMYITA